MSIWLCVYCGFYHLRRSVIPEHIATTYDPVLVLQPQCCQSHRNIVGHWYSSRESEWNSRLPFQIQHSRHQWPPIECQLLDLSRVHQCLKNDANCPLVWNSYMRCWLIEWLTCGTWQWDKEKTCAQSIQHIVLGTVEKFGGKNEESKYCH